ncbi:MAG: DUF6431 domain-containing protein [Actinomycetota bacterium]|nr:DUF6431 domain-containing protein [Actinomycetota bacterium]
MAILWPTPLGVDEYAAAGAELVVPRLACPSCHQPMIRWGSYRRDVRLVTLFQLLIRRQRCRPCGRTHAVLPGFVTRGRLDAIEMIGPLLEQAANHRLVAELARAIDVPPTTASGWWRRFQGRAELLSVGFGRVCVATCGLVPRLSGTDAQVAIGAIRAAFVAAARRFGEQVGTLWRFANAVVGSELLTTNRNPSWSSA